MVTVHCFPLVSRLSPKQWDNGRAHSFPWFNQTRAKTKSKQAINCEANFHSFSSKNRVWLCCSLSMACEARGLSKELPWFLQKDPISLLLRPLPGRWCSGVSYPPASWAPPNGTHTLSALCVIHWHCYPVSALLCTGDRLLETNSPTQPGVTPTYCLPCPPKSKLCPNAILLYF